MKLNPIGSIPPTANSALDRVIDNVRRRINAAFTNIVPDTQYDLKVTGTNWSTVRAVGVPYTVVSPTGTVAWRLRFNITGLLSSVASNVALTIADVSFSDAYRQAIHGSQYTNNTTYLIEAYTNISNNTIELRYSANIDDICISGDVELNQKPGF